ncbi:hypothetical protein GCM10023323_08030 [Streptomyces thinghirensis]|uniref:Uncharacterized protein n=1 Tax=Streptomyces thinghirensis TaxID=551547 RepID=A0ABP9SZH5_9ACTN
MTPSEARYGTAAAAAEKGNSGCNCSRYVARGATGAVEAVGIAGTAGSGRSGVMETYVPASPPFVSSAPPRAYARVASFERWEAAEAPDGEARWRRTER